MKLPAASGGVVKNTIKKHRFLRYTAWVLFYIDKGFRELLLALSSLMPCTGQKLSVLMLSHFFSSFFNDTSQRITPDHYFL